MKMREKGIILTRKYLVIRDVRPIMLKRRRRINQDTDRYAQINALTITSRREIPLRLAEELRTQNDSDFPKI